jgi:hypothetical protein
MTYLKVIKRVRGGYTRLSLALLVLDTVCCTSARTNGRSPIPATQPANATIDSLGSKSATPETIYGPGQLQFALRLEAIIRATGDTLHQPDSSQMTALATVLFRNGERNSIDAIIAIDSIRRFFPGNTSQAFPNQELAFTINQESGHPIPKTSSAQNNCDTDTTQVPFSGVELLPTIPLLPRASWVDTSNIHVCRGGARLTLQRVSAYQLLPGESPTRITRKSQVTVTGTGRQWNQPVQVTGDGISSDTIWLTTTHPRRLDRLDSTSQLNVSFRSSLRVQAFQQTTQMSIVHKQ